MKYKKETNSVNIALVRLERYYPYPEEQMKELLKSYKNAKEVVWAQEEPHNMGALTFLLFRLRKDLAEGQRLYTVSRAESASPAPGSNRVYTSTQKKLLEEAFGKFE